MERRLDKTSSNLLRNGATNIRTCFVWYSKEGRRVYIRVKHALRNRSNCCMILKAWVNISAIFSLNVYLLLFILFPFEVSSTLVYQNTLFTHNSYYISVYVSFSLTTFTLSGSYSLLVLLEVQLRYQQKLDNHTKYTFSSCHFNLMQIIKVGIQDIKLGI